jgi:hypothetical protein
VTQVCRETADRAELLDKLAPQVKPVQLDFRVSRAKPGRRVSPVLPDTQVSRVSAVYREPRVRWANRVPWDPTVTPDGLE